MFLISDPESTDFVLIFIATSNFYIKFRWILWITSQKRTWDISPKDFYKPCTVFFPTKFHHLPSLKLTDIALKIGQIPKDFQGQTVSFRDLYSFVDALILRSTFIVPPTYHAEMNEDCYLDQRQKPCVFLGGDMVEPPILGLDSSQKKKPPMGNTWFCWAIPMKFSSLMPKNLRRSQ